VILLFLMIVFRVLITTTVTPEAVTGNAIKLPYRPEDNVSGSFKGGEVLGAVKAALLKSQKI